MQNKQVNIAPIAISNAVANILNCAITSLSGPVGMTHSQPYLLIRHIRIQNKTAGAVTLTMYKGATGGSVAGTEFAFAAVSIPANSTVDWYGSARLDSTDFITAVAGAATSLVANFEGEVGFA
jgi:hypothetical protein